MEKFGIVVVAALIFLVLAAGLSLLGAIPTMWLWNWLMPKLFSLPTITFWEAWGLNWLCAILFKSTPSVSKKRDSW